jgi:hypothetical protein
MRGVRMALKDYPSGMTALESSAKWQLWPKLRRMALAVLTGIDGRL